MPRKKLSKATRDVLMCPYPRCGRPRVKRHENGRTPSLRRWCYLHFNGELARERRAYVARLKKQEDK